MKNIKKYKLKIIYYDEMWQEKVIYEWKLDDMEFKIN